MSFIQSIWRLLTFRISKEEMFGFTKQHFIAGLAGTWLVGIGRYWDDPGASSLQHAGLGSVIYIFCLSAFVWLIILPFKVENWKYFNIVTFISLTSFPALLYAIPVERFFPLDTAARINVWFLAIVASWRLALLFQFMKRYCDFPGYIVTAVTLLPVCLIINVLSLLNLERAVFEIMGGVREKTANDNAYVVLLIITTISYIFILPLIIAYIIGIANYRKKNGL